MRIFLPNCVYFHTLIFNSQICTSVMITYNFQISLSDRHDNINQSSRKERRLKKYPSKEEKKLESLIVEKNYHLAKEKKKIGVIDCWR